MTNQEIDEFRNQRINSDAGQAVIEQLTGDGTAGHSKGNWVASQSLSAPTSFPNYRDIKLQQTVSLRGDADPVIIRCFVWGNEMEANQNLVLLSQSAPHDCGDPECPGFINKRKLELYDKFQRAIHEFANAGLLT